MPTPYMTVLVALVHVILCANMVFSDSVQTNSPALSGGLYPYGDSPADSEVLSRAFEFRYVTADSAADGETDFKGPTGIFDTSQRVGYLSRWADYGRHFFNDPELNTLVVQDYEIEQVVEKLKPQPLPAVRQVIRLDDWTYLGYREGQREEELERMTKWQQMEGVSVKDGRLILRNNTLVKQFDEQPWRMKASWRAQVPGDAGRIVFGLSENIEVGFSAAGCFFYDTQDEEILAGVYEPNRFYDFDVEINLPESATEDCSATASSFELSFHSSNPPNPPRHALDGDLSTAWYASSSAYPQWIAFDLGDIREVNCVRLSFVHRQGRSYHYRIEMSNDGKSWEQLGEPQSSVPDWMEHDFEPFHAQYLRVYYTGSTDGWASLGQFEVYGTEGQISLLDIREEHLVGTAHYNLFIDGQLVADYVPVSWAVGAAVDRFTASAEGSELHLDALRIVSYGPQPIPRGANRVREYPYLIETLVDDNFKVRPDASGFERFDYDDSVWEKVPYSRYAHGGERHRGESLYLRRMVEIDDFERAVLNVETVRMSGELFINEHKIADLCHYPTQIDISDKLRLDAENLIAVRVSPHDVGRAQFHMSVDTHSSWFAGLMDIALTSNCYIDDVFAYAVDVGDPANLRLQISIDSDSSENFQGRLIARAYPWFPEESDVLAGESAVSFQAGPGQKASVEMDVLITEPDLWAVNTPNLYKVHLILQDESDRDIDDYVLTTGLRTVCQTGGTFRINGRPEMLNGPLLFGYHYPLDRIAQWMFSPPIERWIHDILATKRMNGTAIRMSVHDSLIAGVNDRRLAQIGDQMGIMFLWQTPTWIRADSTDQFDFTGLPLYAKAVRNHPSIAMWQPGNHPKYTIEWYQQVYDTLAAVDHTRLISPSGDMSRMRGEFNNTIGETWRPADDDTTFPVWTAPLLARGTMEQILGYGQEWSSLRLLPGLHPYRGIELEVRMAYLNSPTHAWFDYESEETIGQPNWDVKRGKPYYRMYGYEAYYDVGSIGRTLTFDEWKESQAWQALSAYEAYRKKRWLGYDGMNWCPLRGGGNSATYIKPVIGYHNHAKLGYYSLQMVFQPILAGSKNVDIVYGPNDTIPVMVMNLGPGRKVDVRCIAKTEDGQIVAEKIYRQVDLPDGKGVIDLGSWMPNLEPERYYAFEYIVTASNN